MRCRFRDIRLRRPLQRAFTTTCRFNMDADQFRKAAHAAIEESKELHIHCLAKTHTDPPSNQLQPEHSFLSRAITSQTRLSSASTSVYSTATTSTMGKHPTRYRQQDHTWSNALAIAQVHGFLPRWSHLSVYARRDVFCRFQCTCVQLA
jgi:hypothetical protein